MPSLIAVPSRRQPYFPWILLAGLTQAFSKTEVQEKFLAGSTASEVERGLTQQTSKHLL